MMYVWKKYKLLVPGVKYQAAQTFRRDTCATLEAKEHTHKVSAPKPYVFNNRDVGLGVLEIRGSAGHFAKF